MKKFKKAVAFLLVVCMLVTGNMSLFANAAERDSVSEIGTDMFYRVFHLDAARKFFNADEIKELIDIAAEGGYNQFELYLADNQGYRLALDDMTVKTAYGTYDLTPSLGAGYDHSPHYTDGKNMWLTQADMDSIIAYANSKGIGIVPCINAPGHMGAILESFPQFWYSTTLTTGATGTSKSALNLQNAEAYAFGQALIEKYATYFASKGVKYLNIGADEYGADLMTNNSDGTDNGMDHLYDEGGYDEFVRFVNEAAATIKSLGMTPRAYNDCIYYTGTDIYEGEKIYFDTDIEICYWMAGWYWGNYFRRAEADYLASKGFKMINTNGSYYHVLGDANQVETATSVLSFDVNNFHTFSNTSNIVEIDNPAGAMFCIWCDDARDVGGPNTGTTEWVIENSKDAIIAFGKNVLNQKAPTTKTVDLEKGETYTEVFKGRPTITYEAMDPTIAEQTTTVNEGDKEVGNAVEGTVTSGEYYLGNGNDQYLNIENGAFKYVIREEAKPWTVTVSNGVASFKQGNYYLSNVASGDSFGMAVSTTDNPLHDFKLGVNNGIYMTITLWGSTGDYYVHWASWGGLGAGTGMESTAFRPYEVIDPTTTTVTFDAKKAGTTYAYIGDVEYTINVTSNEEEPETPELQTEVIDVKEGETVGVTVEGDVVGNYDTEDTTIATVTTTYGDGVTKIIFEGKKEGTTYVTIGNVRYTINVSKAEVIEPEPNPDVDEVVNIKVGESYKWPELIAGDFTGNHPTGNTNIATVITAPGTVETTYSIGNPVTGTVASGEYYLGNGNDQYLNIENGAFKFVIREEAKPWTVTVSNGVASFKQGNYYLSNVASGDSFGMAVSTTDNPLHDFKLGVNNGIYMTITLWGSTGDYYVHWASWGGLGAGTGMESTAFRPYEVVENKNTTETSLTFYGHKVGTTYVTIGDVTYQINVTFGEKEIILEEGEYKNITVDGIITGDYPTENPYIGTVTVLGPGEPIKVVGSEVTTTLISGEYYIGAQDKYLIVKDGAFAMVGADEAIPWSVEMVSGSTANSAILKQGDYYFSNVSDGNGGYMIRPLTTAPTYETRFDSVNDLYIVSPDSGKWHFVRWNVSGDSQFVGAGVHTDDALLPEYFGPYAVNKTTSSTTVLSFYGRSEGTTYVTVGDVRYTIKVVENEDINTETINLKVNQIYDKEVPGDVSGVYLTDDINIATVTTKLNAGETTKSVGALVAGTITDGEYYLGNGSQYLIVQNGTWVMVDASKAIPWEVVTTASGVVLKQGNYYLSNYISTENGMPYCQISETAAALSFKFGTNNALCFNFTDANSTSTDLYAYWNAGGWVGAEAYGTSAYLKPYAVNTTSTTVTNLSFYGYEVGTTNVIIGGTKYVINVTEEENETINITIPIGQEVVYRQPANVEDVKVPENAIVDINLLYRRQDGYSWVANPQANQSYYIMGIEQHYLAIEDGKFVTLEEPAEDNKWTVVPKVGGFSLKYGDYYLVNHWHDGVMTLEFLEEDTSAFPWQFDQNRGIYCTDKVVTYRLAHNPITHQWELNDKTTRRIGFSEVEINEGTNATEITFVGKQVGTTTVVIGNKTYNIEVTSAEAPKKQEFSIEYWITNNRCVDKADGTTDRYTISYDNPEVATEEGMKIGGLVAQTAARLDAQSGDIQDENLVFWKTSVNAEGYKQEVGLEGRTTSGTFFDRIRFWHGKWSVSGDGDAWRVLEDTDQLVAYYIQETDVTKEVTTYAMDWGIADATNAAGTGGYTASYDAVNDKDYSYVLLDFAVQYESGLRTPDDFPRAETIGFHCDHADINVAKAVGSDVDGYWYRKLGVIQAEAIEGFEVYMITLTPHTDDKTMLSELKTTPVGVTYSYEGTEKVVWIDDEANLGMFADESLHAEGYHVGGTPYVPEITIYEHQAMLVTYYVRVVEPESALEVHYHDASGLVDGDDSIGLEGAPEFYMYNISVKGNTVFPAGDIYIDRDGNLVNATVLNSLERYETVTSDLSAMPAIPVQYRYGKYEFVTFRLSDDNKQLHLYYTSEDPIYVVDFGLPVKIDLGLNNNAKAEILAKPTYGTAAIDGDVLTYTPSKILRSIDSIIIKITEDGATDGAIRNYKFYPATTVYYEEGFMSIKDSSWSGAGNALANEQTATLLGEEVLNYGYDAHYSTQVNGPSNGTYLVSTDPNGYAEFTFTGTGVDIYANCDPESGSINVLVRNSAGKLVKMLQINTKMASEGSATAGQNVTASNIPVASIDFGTTHDTYTVQIRHIKTVVNNAPASKPVQLDGFRVFNTLPDSNVYKEDGEANPTFVEVRDMIFGGFGIDTIVNAVKKEEGNTSSGSDYFENFTAEELAKALTQVLDLSQSGSGIEAGSAMIIDGEAGHDNAYVQDLLDNGPKNEVYLRPEQSLVFKPAAGIDVQIGLKAINADVTCDMNGEEYVISSSTDMFYELGTMDGNTTVTITNISGGILAITDMKWMISAENSDATASPFMSLGEEDFVSTFMLMGFRSSRPAPEPEPEVTEKILYQTNANSTDVRLIAYLDDLTAYSKVSFELTIDGRTSKELVCTSAYSGLYANGELYTTEDIYGVDGYFVTYTINRYLEVYAGKEVTITVTYTTVTGETVTAERTVTIE